MERGQRKKTPEEIQNKQIVAMSFSAETIVVLLAGVYAALLYGEKSFSLRWAWGAYVAPVFWPTVISHNVEDHFLGVISTLKTIDGRAESVRLVCAVLHAFLATVLMDNPSLAVLTSVLWLALPTPPRAVVLEAVPRGGPAMDYEDFETIKMNETVDLVQDRLPKSYFTAAPKTVEIQRAIRYADFDVDASLFALSNTMDRVNEQNDNGEYIWDDAESQTVSRLYATSCHAPTEYDAKDAEKEQRACANLLREALGKAGIANVDIVAGDPTLSTPFAELSRVPANPGARIVVDLDHVYPYEDWFDHHVADRSFVTMVSFAPLATLNHGLDASNVKVCLFAQGWATGEIEWYEGSKNTMPCPETAKALSERAWVSVFLTDEAFYTVDSLALAYEGDTIQDCINTYETFHGWLDSTVADQLVESASEGSHAPFHDRFGALVLPNFATQKIILNPLSVWTMGVPVEAWSVDEEGQYLTKECTGRRVRVVNAGSLTRSVLLE